MIGSILSETLAFFILPRLEGLNVHFSPNCSGFSVGRRHRYLLWWEEVPFEQFSLGFGSH